MGRCYEFGVSIAAGCDHAMVVVEEGGACRCVSCATICRGRFAGCVRVLSTPGYVPVLAPRRALVPRQSASVPADPLPAQEVNGHSSDLRMPGPAAPPAPAPPTAAEIERRALERALLDELRASGTVVGDLRKSIQELAIRINDLEVALGRVETTGNRDLLR
ncbi:MAG TPA: hypothetical protein VF230_13475 [Acidimicrobiales bacterium]